MPRPRERYRHGAKRRSSKTFFIFFTGMYGSVKVDLDGVYLSDVELSQSNASVLLWSASPDRVGDRIATQVREYGQQLMGVPNPYTFATWTVVPLLQAEPPQSLKSFTDIFALTLTANSGFTVASFFPGSHDETEDETVGMPTAGTSYGFNGSITVNITFPN